MARFQVLLAYDDPHGQPHVRTLATRARTAADAVDLARERLGVLSRQIRDDDVVAGTWSTHRVGWGAHRRRRHHGLLTSEHPGTAAPALPTAR
jgi:hypothetical protein